jgi:hypothetical protein
LYKEVKAMKVKMACLIVIVVVSVLLFSGTALAQEPWSPWAPYPQPRLPSTGYHYGGTGSGWGEGYDAGYGYGYRVSMPDTFNHYGFGIGSSTADYSYEFEYTYGGYYWDW